jgi:sugar lactone lactonase YvrE
MNLRNKSVLSFVAMVVVFASSCSTSKVLPVFSNSNTDINSNNSRVKVTPADPKSTTGNEQISVDVGQGIKTGASISITLNLGENFKTKANKDGSVAFTTSAVKSIKVWLVELPLGSSPIAPDTDITPVSGTSFSYDNTTANPIVTFNNVPANTTTPQQQAYYVAVAAYKNVVANGQPLSDNISNNTSATNRVTILGTTPAAISNGGGDTGGQVGSVMVGAAPDYLVSTASGLSVGLKLLDDIGATIETNIAAQSGSTSIGSPGLLNISGFIETLAGDGISANTGEGGPATSAQLRAPGGVAIDNSNNIIFSDTNNCVIKKINTTTGIITTIGGSGSCGQGGGPSALTTNLFHPNGISIDLTNNEIYFADTDNHVIRRFIEGGNMSVSAGVVGVACTSGACNDGGPPTSALLKNPEGVALDPANNIYIADTGNHAIRKVNISIPQINRIAGNATFSAGDGPDTGIGTSIALNFPKGIVIGSTGNVYFSDTGNHIIRKISGSQMSRVAGNTAHTAGNTGDGGAATSAQLDSPSGIAFDKNNNLFVVDYMYHVVRKINTVTGVINRYAGDTNGGYNGDGIAATSAHLNDPHGIYVDDFGSLYIADTANNRIRIVH